MRPSRPERASWAEPRAAGEGRSFPLAPAVVQTGHDSTQGIAVEELPVEELRRLVGELLGEVARLREEGARLKGLPGRRKVKPSGVERAAAPKGERPRGKAGRARGTTERMVQEELVLAIAAPPGSRLRATRTSSSRSCGWRRG